MSEERMTFENYLRFKEIIEETLSTFYEATEALNPESAYGTGNITRQPILFDYDDIAYLYSFPPEYWATAMQKRYGETLINALKEREDGKPLPNISAGIDMAGKGGKGGSHVEFGPAAIQRAMSDVRPGRNYFYEEDIPGGGHRIVVNKNKKSVHGKIGGAVTPEFLARISKLTQNVAHIPTRMNKLIPKLETKIGKLTPVGGISQYGFDFSDFVPGIGDFIPASSKGYVSMPKDTKSTLVGGREELESGRSGTSWLRGMQPRKLGSSDYKSLSSAIRVLLGTSGRSAALDSPIGDTTVGKILAQSFGEEKFNPKTGERETIDPDSREAIELVYKKLSKKLRTMPGLSPQDQKDIKNLIKKEARFFTRKSKYTTRPVIASGRPEQFEQENFKEMIRFLASNRFSDEEKMNAVPSLPLKWQINLLDAEVPDEEKIRLVPELSNILRSTDDIIEAIEKTKAVLKSKIGKMPERKDIGQNPYVAESLARKLLNPFWEQRPGLFTDPEIKPKQPEDWEVRAGLEPKGLSLGSGAPVIPRPIASKGAPPDIASDIKKQNILNLLRTASLVKPSQIRTSRAIYSREDDLKRQIQAVQGKIAAAQANPELSQKAKQKLINDLRTQIIARREITPGELMSVYNSEADPDQKWKKVKEFSLSRGIKPEDYEDLFSQNKIDWGKLNKLLDNVETKIPGARRLLDNYLVSSGLSHSTIKSIVGSRLSKEDKIKKFVEEGGLSDKEILSKIIWLSKGNTLGERFRRVHPKTIIRGVEGVGREEVDEILAKTPENQQGLVIRDFFLKKGLKKEEIDEILSNNTLSKEEKINKLIESSKKPWSLVTWKGVGPVRTFTKTFVYVKNGNLYIDMDVPIPILEAGRKVNPSKFQDQLYGGWQPTHSSERASPIYPRRKEEDLSFEKEKERQLENITKDPEYSDNTLKLISILKRIEDPEELKKYLKDLLKSKVKTAYEKKFIQQVAHTLFDPSLTEGNKRDLIKKLEINFLSQKISDIELGPGSDEDKKKALKALRTYSLIPTFEEKRREDDFMRRIGFQKTVAGDEALWKHDYKGEDWIEQGLQDFISSRPENEPEVEVLREPGWRDMAYRLAADYVRKNARESRLPDIVFPGESETRQSGVAGLRRRTELGAKLKRKYGEKIYKKLSAGKTVEQTANELNLDPDFVNAIKGVLDSDLPANEKAKQIREIEVEALRSDVDSKELANLTKRQQAFIRRAASNTMQKLWQLNIAGEGTRRTRRRMLSISQGGEEGEDNFNKAANIVKKTIGGFNVKTSKDLADTKAFKALDAIDKELIAGKGDKPRFLPTGQPEDFSYRQENRQVILAWMAMRRAYQKIKSLQDKALEDNDDEKALSTQMQIAILEKEAGRLKNIIDASGKKTPEENVAKEREIGKEELSKPSIIPEPEEVADENLSKSAQYSQGMDKESKTYEHIYDFLLGDEVDIEENVKKLASTGAAHDYIIAILYDHFNELVVNHRFLSGDYVNQAKEFIKVATENGYQFILDAIEDGIVDGMKSIINSPQKDEFQKEWEAYTKVLPESLMSKISSKVWKYKKKAK